MSYKINKTISAISITPEDKRKAWISRDTWNIYQLRKDMKTKGNDSITKIKEFQQLSKPVQINKTVSVMGGGAC